MQFLQLKFSGKKSNERKPVRSPARLIDALLEMPLGGMNYTDSAKTQDIIICILWLLFSSSFFLVDNFPVWEDQHAAVFKLIESPMKLNLL